MKQLYLLSLLLCCTACVETEEFPLVQERTPQECGPACLTMIAQYYGKGANLEQLIELTQMDAQVGTTLEQLSTAATQLNFQTMTVKIPYEALLKKAPKPCVVHWEGRYFVVVYKMEGGSVFLAHPKEGLVVFDAAEFKKYWLMGTEGTEGVVLAMEPRES